MLEPLKFLSKSFKRGHKLFYQSMIMLNYNLEPERTKIYWIVTPACAEADKLDMMTRCPVLAKSD